MLNDHPTGELACLIVAHNLGDAVIQSQFFESLVSAGYASRYLVWTRPQAAFLFAHLPNCLVVCSHFPVGTNKQFTAAALLQFIKVIWRIRRLQPSVTIDLIGDVRDRWFARAAGSRRHIFLGWAPSHPFSRLIRNPFGKGKPQLTVLPSVENVYEAHRILLGSLLCDSNVRQKPAASNFRYSRLGTPMRIGIHPFASQECKLWPERSWRALVSLLLEDPEVSIVAFGAPSERSALEEIFAEFKEIITLITVSLPEFAKETAGLDVMVGLDSFSVHMAQRQGVRSILINAGNPKGLWAPPLGEVLASSGGCHHYPCFNIPKCVGTDFEFACVKSISVDAVANAIRNKTPPR